MAIERISQAQDGTEGNGISVTGDGRGISQDGRYIVFQSLATTLGSADGDTDVDIYRTDTTTGEVVLVSAGAAGFSLSGPNRQPVISADGNIVAFINGSGTTANGLPQGDLYVVNVATGDIDLIQTNAANPSLSADGTKLVFESTDDANGSGTDVNGAADVFLVTLSNVSAVSITRVSDAASGGVSGDGASYLPVISADGNFIAFESLATDLVGGDLNGQRDVFRYNVATGAIELVSAAATPTAGASAAGQSANPSISGDGSVVTFTSDAADLGPSDTNSTFDIYANDFGAGTVTRVSEGTGGVQAVAPSFRSSISDDGRFVAFQTSEALDPADTNGVADVYVRDLSTGDTALVSAGGNLGSEQPMLSGDGSQIAFTSDATTLVAADGNGVTDVFVADNPLFGVAPTPVLTVAITEAEISENGGVSSATVTRSGSTTGDLVVTLGSSDASEATVPATVTILDGEASATFDVTGADDTDVDGTQTVTVTASAAGFTDGTDSIDVTDDDVPPTPELFLTLANDTILENGGTTFGLLERTGDTTGDLVVMLTSSDTTEATVPPTVTIPDGAASVQITVTGQDDPDIDGSQPVTITASATGYTDGSDFLEVLDDDLPNPPVFSIIASPATGDAVAEGAPGAGGLMTFVVERTGDTSRIDSVDYRIETGTAGSDDFTTFVPTLDPLIFGVGETIKTFDVQFSGDTDFEPDETFTVSLQNPSAGAGIDLAAASVTGTILNDDAPAGPVELIVNGGFEDHPDLPFGPAPGWGTFDDIPGWQAIIGQGTNGQIEVQELSGPSGNVEGDAVVELDAAENSLIQQTVTVPTAGIHRLSFDYAMGGLDPLTNGVVVIVNGDAVATLYPDTPGYQTFALDLDLPAGDVTLGFAGLGTSDARGTHIDDVSLIAVTPNGANAYPIAVDDMAETDEATPVSIDVLGNDSDPDFDPLLLIDVDAPASGNGTVVLERDGTVTYTPNAGFTGQDTFTYTVADGRGGSDTGTVTVRVGPQGPVFGEELIVNGEFEEHPDLPNGPAPGWGIFSAITGWTALVGGIEVQELSGPSGNVEGDAVVELDADGNSVIEQIVDVPADGFYRFAFDYAAAGDAATNGIAVSVGGQVIDVPPPTPGYDTFEIVLELTAGANAVVFEGLGTSDARGTHIDSVSLQRVPPPEPPAGNLFVNGDFEDHPDLPNGPAPGWGVFAEILGWVATVGGIEVQELSGPSGNAEGDAVVELDADFNSRIEQTVTVDADGLFEFSFDYALGGDDPTTNGMDVFVNDDLLVSLSPVAPGYAEFSTVLDLAAGDYTFAFAATGTSDARGTHINNVSLSSADDILAT